MAKVSDKSTKAQILEEVARLEAELKASRAANTTVAQVQEQKMISAKKESAKTVVEMNILNDAIVKQYNDVIESIEVFKKELADIQGVKEAIIDAEAVIMAKDNLIAKREEEALAKLAEIEAKSQELIAKREAAIAETQATHDEMKRDLLKAREREVEEYKYNKERTRKLENDAWEDEKALRLKDITDKEAALNARQDAIYDAEKELSDLREAVDQLPGLLVKAKEEGKTEAEKQLAKEKAIEVNAVKKNAEWEIKMATMEKERAIEELAKANDKINSLEAKLEAAYASMNTLATTTVQSTGGVKILETGKDK